MKKIILEGCNGEWAQERYLPTLTKKAAGGEIQLWAVDIEDSMKLGSPLVKKEWQVAQSENGAHYLNKNRDRQTYSAFSNADYVFVVAPDRVHSKIVRCWLDRLAPEGKIFIEKPLAASVSSAYRLKKEIEAKEKKEAVFAFDHYLARAYPFLLESNRYLEQIGGVEKIEFHLLEYGEIPPERVKTLDKGMIFDLFCHALALVCAVVSQNLTCSAAKLKTVEPKGVKAARYINCPSSGETFALIELTIDSNIKVLTAVGKCVGDSDEKFIKIYGREEQIIKVEFSTKKDKLSIIESQGETKEYPEREPRHVESFLEGVLQGKDPSLMLPGVISFDAALGILKILGKAKQQSKQQIGKMPVYQCNDSIDKILEIL